VFVLGPCKGYTRDSSSQLDEQIIVAHTSDVRSTAAALVTVWSVRGTRPLYDARSRVRGVFGRVQKALEEAPFGLFSIVEEFPGVIESIILNNTDE